MNTYPNNIRIPQNHKMAATGSIPAVAQITAAPPHAPHHRHQLQRPRLQPRRPRRTGPLACQAVVDQAQHHHPSRRAAIAAPLLLLPTAAAAAQQPAHALTCPGAAAGAAELWPFQRRQLLLTISSDYNKYADTYEQLDAGAIPEALGFAELRQQLIAKVGNWDLCMLSGACCRNYQLHCSVTISAC
jgi:hypothetical protein